MRPSEDAKSKLAEVVSDVGDEDRVGNSLLQTWNLQSLSTRFGQDFEVEIQARFEAGAWASFFCWCFVGVIKLNLGRDS